MPELVSDYDMTVKYAIYVMKYDFFEREPFGWVLF